MTNLMTGSRIGVLFIYQDGATSVHGSWTVPQSHEYGVMDSLGESMGNVILYEMAKQPWKTVVKCEIRAMKDMPESTMHVDLDAAPD